MTLGEFAEVAVQLCLEFQCSETSGYRTELRNAKVGGKPNSKHRLGLARDLVPDDNLPHVRASLVAAAQARGLGAVDEGDHVHIQVRRALPPREA